MRGQTDRQNGGVNSSPLSHATVEICGAPFLVIWRPEDDAVVAAGFWGGADADRFAGADQAALPHSPEQDPLWHRLHASDPSLTARGAAPAPTELGTVPDALRAYASGDLAAIDSLRVAQRETPFRGEVWRALRDVTPGQPVTYTELALRAGRPSAVRAAASGCASNLVALIVPCHRIVRTDGGVGGYLFGAPLKRLLLAHEAS